VWCSSIRYTTCVYDLPLKETAMSQFKWYRRIRGGAWLCLQGKWYQSKSDFYVLQFERKLVGDKEYEYYG
jgi:hypothetical protein